MYIRTRERQQRTHGLASILARARAVIGHHHVAAAVVACHTRYTARTSFAAAAREKLYPAQTVGPKHTRMWTEYIPPEPNADTTQNANRIESVRASSQHVRLASTPSSGSTEASVRNRIDRAKRAIYTMMSDRARTRS
jgi:hypothetical protein